MCFVVAEQELELVDEFENFVAGQELMLDLMAGQELELVEVENFVAGQELKQVEKVTGQEL